MTGPTLDKDIEIGDEIELIIDGRESTWTVMGLILSVNVGQRDNFVPFSTLTRKTGNINRGTLAMVLSGKHDPETQQRLVRDLRDAYSANHMKATDFQSASEVRKDSQTQFGVLIYLMLVMAILSAVVGGLGLMGTLSINVVERRREIGVMRAIGATSPTIAGVFISEGVLLGALSWLIAVPFSYPGARIFSRLVGETLMHFPLDFSFSTGGVVLWLLIVVSLSTLASLWPAMRAARLSVRESLAYE